MNIFYSLLSAFSLIYLAYQIDRIKKLFINKNVKLDVQLLDGGIMPTRAYPNDAGLDLYAPTFISILPYSDLLVPLNIKINFSHGWVLLIREKSGICTKKKVIVGASVIDSTYTGVPHVHLINLSDVSVSFREGDKIAQCLLIPVWCGTPANIDILEIKSARGNKGFGSTGK